MLREILVTTAAIDEFSLAAGRAISNNAGAVVTFQGFVRDTENSQKISGIEYEAFEAMARHQFEIICTEVEQHWPIESIRLVHRIGFVAANHPSLWVEVAAGHRGEAFAACQYLIGEMKKRVPIWKKPAAA